MIKPLLRLYSSLFTKTLTFMVTMLLFSTLQSAGQSVVATGTNGACPSSATITGTASGFPSGSNITYRLMDGTVQVRPIGSSPNYQVSPTFNSLNAGTYTVEAFDQANNIIVSSSAITVSETYVPMVISRTTTKVTCNNGSDGSIIVTVNNGTPSYQYAITSGPVTRPLQTSNIFSGLPIGNYTVSITDACGVTVNTLAEVINDSFLPDIRAYSRQVFEYAVPQDCSSGITVNSVAWWDNNIGYTTNPNFRWKVEYPANSGVFYGNNTLLSVGKISIPATTLGLQPATVYLYDLCGSTPKTYNVDPADIWAVDIQTPICGTTGSIIYTLDSRALLCFPFNFTITDQGSNTIVQTSNSNSLSNTFTGLQPGTTYTLTLVDGAGRTLNYTINMPSSAPLLGAFPSKAESIRDRIHLVANNPSYSGQNFNWQILTGPYGIGISGNGVVNNGGSFFIPNPNSPDSVWPSGTYIVRLTVGSCLTQDLTMSATGYQGLATNVKIVDVCNGFNLALEGSFPEPAGTYGLRILSGPAGTAQLTSVINSSTISDYINNLPYGTYVAQLTVLGTGGNFLQNFNFTVSQPQITLNSGNSGGVVCNTNSTTMGTLYVDASSSLSTASLSYSLDDITYQSSNVFTNIAYGSNGTHTVYIKDNCGNKSTFTVSQTVPPTPTATGNGQTMPSVCEGKTLALDVNVVGALSYSWAGPNGFTSTIKNPSITNLSAQNAGIYTLTIDLGCGSTSTSSVNVTVDPLPSAPTATAAGATSFPYGGNVVLSSSSTSGNQWYKNGVAIAGANGQTYQATTSGVYTVVTTNNHGCESPASNAITVTVQPIVNATGTNGTCPSSASIVATPVGFPSNASLSYRLKESSSGTFIQPNDGSYQSSAAFIGLPAGTYIVEVLDQTNNLSANTSVSVTETYNPMILNYTKTDILCAGANTGQITLNVSAGSPSYSYSIVSGPVTRPTQTSNIFAGLPQGNYTISVTDACGVSKPLIVTLVEDVVNLNNIEVFIGPSLANVNPGDCSAQQFSIYGLATNGVQGAVKNRIRISYEYPAGSGNFYGAGGVLGAPGVIYTSDGTDGIIPFPTSLGVPTSPYNVVLTDDCGNQRILNNNKLPDPKIISINRSFCNSGITLSLSIGGNACLNATIVFTDNSDATKVFTYNLTTSSQIIGNSGLEPGHTYTVSGVDGTNSSVVFGGNGVYSTNQVSTPASNTPAFMTFYNVICNNTVDPVLIIPDGSAGPITATITSGPAGTVGKTLTAPALSVGGGMQFVGLPLGSYTISFTSNCQSGSVSGNYTLDPLTISANSVANCSGATVTVTSPPISGNQNGTPFSYYGGGIEILPGSASRVGTSVPISSTGTSTFTNLTPGNYIFALGGATCIIAQTNLTITLPTNPITIDAGSTGGYVCNNNPSTTGTLVIQAASATGSNLYYSIDNGATYGGAGVNTFPNVPYGTNGQFQVKVKDDCNNIISYIASLSVSPTPTATGNGQNMPAVCEGKNIQLDINIIGANSYSWTGPNGFTSNIKNPVLFNVTNSQSGTYSVSVATSCGTLNSSVNVTVNPLPATPTVTAATATTFCQGRSVVLSSSASTGNQWYFNGTAITGATAQTYTANASGSYTVIVTNGNSCSSAVSAATTVTVNPLPATPTVTAASATTFCQGGSVMLSSSATTGNQWYLNGIAITGATSQNYTANSSGSYTVIETNGNGCASPASAATTVTVNPLPATPTVTAASATTFCQGGSVVLSSSATTGNQWYLNGTAITGATSQNYTANSSGSYTVIETNGNGCASPASAATTVTVNPLPATPTVTAASATTFCQGGSVVLSSSATTGNQWYLNGTAITGATAQTYTANASGSYMVIETNGNGCASPASATTTVTVNPLPATPTVIAASATTFCQGGSVVLSSSATTGNQWYLNGTTITGATSQNYTANASGSYTVIVTNGNTCSSPASAATTVTVNPLPATPTVTAATATTFCQGGSVVLSSSAATGNQWYLNGTAITGATAQTYTANASGSYTVIETNGNGCASPASATTTVTVNPLPATPTVTAATATTFCQGGSVVLSSSATTGNQWYLNGTAITGATSQNYTANASGSYMVIVTDGNTCSSPASVATTVMVNPLPTTPTVTAATATTFCQGGSVVLSSSAATGNQWYLNGTAITGATAQNYTANASGSYTVIETNGSGCASPASAATTVTVNPLPATPTVSAASATTFCQGGSVVLSSSSATGNQWYLNGTSITGATAQNYTANASGSYTVIVTDGNTCSSPASTATTVTVNPLPTIPTVTAATATTFCQGGSVVLSSSAATGNQWYLNGTSITGATAQTYTANASGSYTVIETNGNGCASPASATTTVTVNPLPATPMVTAASATTFCQGGSVVLSSSATTGNQWYLNGTAITGATSQNYTANASGSYTVIVTDGNTCSSPASAATTVTVNPLPATPTVTAATATTFCQGGSVVLSSSAATGNKWYLNGTAITGATAQNYTANASGSYTVIVTDGNTCSSPASAATTVMVNPLPTTPMVTAATATTFCQGGSVVLSSSATTGNQWYLNGTAITGATAQTYTANASGSYTVIETNGNGCASPASATTTVTVNPLPATPTVTAATATTFCQGGSVVLSSSAATGNQWYLNGTAITGATAQTYKANASGSYTVIVTDGNTCSSPASAATTVTVNPFPATPMVTAATATTFCQGGSVVLSSSATTGNQWYLNGTAITGATAQTYTANASGSYTVIVTDGNTCSSPASAATTVTVNPLPATPTVTAASATTFCQGGSVVLSSSATTGNQWYLNGTAITGATAQNYTANAGGSYTVIVTDGNTCSSPASAAITVTVNPLPATPTVTAATATIFCQGGSVVLSTSAATGNQWYLNGTAITGATAQNYTANASGSYTVIVTDGNTCSSPASAATTVTVNPLPATPTVTAATATTFCQGGSVVLSSSATTGNQWYLNGTAITGATAQNYTANASGSYTVIEANGSGCASLASAATTVTVNPLPATPTVTAATATTFCQGGSVVLSSSAATGNQWYLNGTTITGATAQTYTANASGSYTVIATNGNGCTSLASAATTITVDPVPSQVKFTIVAQPTCNNPLGEIAIVPLAGGLYSVDGGAYSGTLNYSLPAGSHTITVRNASGCLGAVSTVVINSQPSTPTASITYGATQFQATGTAGVTRTGQAGGTFTAVPSGLVINAQTGLIDLSASVPNQVYTVSYTFSNGNCSSSTTATVQINSTPATISYGANTFCATGEVTPVVTGPTGGIFTVNPSLIINSSTGKINLNGALAGNYVVTYTYKNGALTASALVNFTVNALPVVEITPSVFGSISKGDVITLSSSPGSAFTWSGPDIVSGQSTGTVEIRPRATTTYTVLVKNSSGCSASASITIHVVEDVKIVPNNVITPNGDGKNDRWYVSNIDYYPNNKVSIYDRAGRKVFYAKGYKNDWDGTYNGMPLNEDAYYYVIDLGKGLRLIRGSISIIRDNR